MQYNTQRKKLVLPEYGRNIQTMVDYCVAIEDREERTRCAHAIVAVMENLFPEQAANPELRNRVWDHINIMSDFKLDIDFPCEVVREDTVRPVPERLEYNFTPIRHRNLGRIIEHMMAELGAMPDGPEKDAAAYYVANQMKKLELQSNPDATDNERVYRDIEEYTSGKVKLNEENCPLCDYQGIARPEATKKKKKK